MQVTRYQSVSGILAVSVSKMAVLMKILACLRRVEVVKSVGPLPPQKIMNTFQLSSCCKRHQDCYMSCRLADGHAYL